MGTLFESASKIILNTGLPTSKFGTGRFSILLEEAMVYAKKRIENDV